MITRRLFLEKLALMPFACFIPGFLVKSSEITDDYDIYQLQGRERLMNIGFVPPYIELHRNGELKKRGQNLWNRMENCDLCPRYCEANRLRGERGDCKANSTLEISSYGPHFGEEPELVGRNGSGTIFFTNCSLLCVFCINYDVSQLGHGRSYSINDLADMMLALQRRGCHNINLVTPTHYLPHILLALDQAASKGLKIPVVYNSSGWENLDILIHLENVVDIYLPDFKYGCNETAGIYSIGAWDYVEVTQQAILEMHRQVGKAIPNPDTGLLNRGLILRHLVMPNNVGCTDKVLEWVADNLPKDTYINLMSQYTPVFRAREFRDINRRITVREYASAIETARSLGLTNVNIQGY